ncbi:MAG: lipid-binding protein [Flavobacteriales bacterium]|nr:MAG: lipid-binding protein [Flavobacteriales bacterium]
MKRILLFVFLILGISLTFSQRRKIKFDKVVRVKKSEIQWWGYKIVKSEHTTHTGVVPMKMGKLLFNNKKLVGGEFLIDMRKLNNTDLRGKSHDLLNKHLKSSDFFDVRKYPMAKFKISKLIPQKDKEYNYEVVGRITIKGVRKTISFPANIVKNDYAITFTSAKFSINRQDFKAFYNYCVKDYFIRDEVDLKIQFSTIK